MHWRRDVRSRGAGGSRAVTPGTGGGAGTLPKLAEPLILCEPLYILNDPTSPGYRYESNVSVSIINTISILKGYFRY